MVVLLVVVVYTVVVARLFRVSDVSSTLNLKAAAMRSKAHAADDRSTLKHQSGLASLSESNTGGKAARYSDDVPTVEEAVALLDAAIGRLASSTSGTGSHAAKRGREDGHVAQVAALRKARQMKEAAAALLAGHTAGATSLLTRSAHDDAATRFAKAYEAFGSADGPFPEPTHVRCAMSADAFDVCAYDNVCFDMPSSDHPHVNTGIVLLVGTDMPGLATMGPGAGRDFDVPVPEPLAGRVSQAEWNERAARHARRIHIEDGLTTHEGVASFKKTSFDYAYEDTGGLPGEYRPRIL